ncbi:MAG TPA: DUF5309 family protein [bacterium]|nr:DUF5309 family protein [bacterium]
MTDVLTKIGDMTTPAYAKIRKVSAKNTLHEWSTYEHDAVAVNAAVEGATFQYGTLTAPSRLTNYTQIFSKTFQVSNTQQAVDPAGMENEYAFRVQVALEAIGRDIEGALINGTANSGASGTGRRLKGILSFISTNISTGSGTGRALSEAELNGLIQDCYENGGRPDWLLGSYTQVNKLAQLMSADRTYNDGNKEFTSQMLVYSSPFGRVMVEGDSQIASDTLTVLQKDMWAIAQLRPVAKKDTPETADAKNGVLLGELTLEGRSEKMNGKMTGLATS